jgi:polar amino acid transport system substrate-binding protein
LLKNWRRRAGVAGAILIMAGGMGALSAVPAVAESPITVAQAPVVSPTANPAPPVVIPDFWDPRRRVERPPSGAVPVIRFITTDDFPPFNFLDESGHLTGFNVDLARAICDELGIPCTIQAREWDELVERIVDKAADAAIAGIAVTAVNREKLDFSDVYLRTPGRFVVRRADAALRPTPQALRGRTLAVVEKTAHEAYLAAMFPEVPRKLYATADEARTAVRDGEADATFGDGLQLSFWLQSEAAADCCTFAGGPYLEARFFGQGYAVAVSKDARDLKHAINAALQSVYEKGVYAELYLRYFPIGFF